MQRGQQIKCECAYQEAFKWVKNPVCMNHRRSTNFSSSAVHLANVVHLDVMLPLELWLSGNSSCFLHEKEKSHWCTASVELPAISRGNTNGNKRFETHIFFDLWISAVRTGFLLIKGNFSPRCCYNQRKPCSRLLSEILWESLTLLCQVPPEMTSVVIWHNANKITLSWMIWVKIRLEMRRQETIGPGWL